MGAMAIEGGATDAELVRSVLDGDRAAFGELYDRYARFVRAICYDTTRNVPDARDMAQEAFLRAYRGLGDLRRPDRFAAWLTVIARTLCRQWCRSRSREMSRRRDVEPAEMEAPASDPANNGLAPLHRALMALPERERLAVQAFYLLDQSRDQARAALNLSRSGLYRLRQRARGRLKRLLAEDREDLT